MNKKNLGIILMFVSPSLFPFQIWLLSNPSWLDFFGFLNFFGFRGAGSWSTIYYSYLLPSWVFLTVMLFLGIRLYVIETRKIAQKRPDGISIIAILWLFSGLHNLFISSMTIFLNKMILDDWGIWWQLDSLFYFQLNAETILGFTNLFLGFLQVVTVLWLWKGKKYSYKLALVVPIIIVISNFCSIALYACSPFPFGIGFTVEGTVLGTVWNVWWLSIFWWYLRKSHVKAFLGIGQPVFSSEDYIRRNIEAVSIYG